jgi:protein-S-isoprenylcysteine O-methyltransferase Ste14
MQKFLILVFGLIAYLVFLPTFLYLIAFVGNLQTSALVDALPALAWLVPHSVDVGREAGTPALAVVVDLGLIALFGVQHSVMARAGFKRWLERMLPRPAERSVFVLMSSLALIVMFWQWRPLPGIVWSVDSTLGQAVLWTIFAVGFGIVFVSTFLIDHFDLFGLKQIWTYFRGHRHTPPQFRTPLFYRLIRHPLYFGFLLGFWSTPQMTVGHLLFAAGFSAYIVIGIRFEEQDLRHYLGTAYRRYCEQVPRLIPLPGRTWREPKTSA